MHRRIGIIKTWRKSKLKIHVMERESIDFLWKEKKTFSINIFLLRDIYIIWKRWTKNGKLENWCHNLFIFAYWKSFFFCIQFLVLVDIFYANMCFISIFYAKYIYTILKAFIVITFNFSRLVESWLIFLHNFLQFWCNFNNFPCVFTHKDTTQTNSITELHLKRWIFINFCWEIFFGLQISLFPNCN